MTDRPDPAHFSIPLYPFVAGERSVTQGLRKRCQELEEIIAPHVTDGKTDYTISFKGKKSYVILPDDQQGERLVFAATEALQCLYNLQAALKAKDIDEAVRWAFGLALADTVDIVKQYGWDGVMAAALLQLEHWTAQARRSAGGKATSKWTSEVEDRAREIFDAITANGKVSKEEACRRTKKKLAEENINISVSTLKRHLHVQR